MKKKNINTSGGVDVKAFLILLGDGEAGDSDGAVSRSWVDSDENEVCSIDCQG